MSNQKRRLESSDSDPYSSSPPSVEGTSTWSGKKARVPRRPPRGKDLEMQMEEQQIKMKELESQMEEEMKKLRKGVKELKRKNKEQENEIKELRNREEEREKEMKKLKKWVKEIRNKPDSNCLSSGNPSSSRTVQEGDTKRLKLHIEMKVPKRVYTGDKLAGDLGNSIRISLINAENGQTITSGTESSVTIHVVALDGNFNRGDHEYWPAEEFDRFIVKGRKQKGNP
ncbi:hypothetical protein MLD38_010018 [Melastoma candidum]|uniref:Uncharacterized protein n=1 Tax=Melastoma candidum TaxID=119954 RepID=A0ACB9QYJ7_9MYRT|nr:hypothetical protein MLD38_010018 [Melastoma candidum]